MSHQVWRFGYGSQEYFTKMNLYAALTLKIESPLQNAYKEKV